MAEQKQIFLMRPYVGEEELQLVREVLESKYLVDGPMTREFERLICEHTGAKYAVACTSATTGLEMSLRALDVGPGDEVIVPDFTHPATGLCVMSVGATPVMVDVDLVTRNITASHMEAAVTDRTKAAIPVSWGGHPLDIGPINDLAAKHNFHVVDDAACGLGTTFKGKRTGSHTDFTVFSFHPRKLFTTGDGGCITTDNQEWADYMNSYKQFGAMKIDGKNRFGRLGTNQRFSSILAAVAVGQLRRIDHFLDDRIKRAAVYDDLLKDIPGISIPYVTEGAKHTFQSYTILFEEAGKRDYIRSELKNRKIEVQIGAQAIHREPVFKDARVVGDMTNSEKLADDLLTLPLHHELTPEDQAYVVGQLRELL